MCQAAATKGAWFRALRLVAMDGATLDVPDSAENDEHFGRPGSSRGEGMGCVPAGRLSLATLIKAPRCHDRRRMLLSCSDLNIRLRVSTRQQRACVV